MSLSGFGQKTSKIGLTPFEGDSKFIDREQLLKLAAKLEKSGYGDYLKRVAK